MTNDYSLNNKIMDCKEFFYEVKMRALRKLDEESKTPVTHVVLVEALNFGEAEKRARAIVPLINPDDTNPYAVGIKMLPARKCIMSGEEKHFLCSGMNAYLHTWFSVQVEYNLCGNTFKKNLLVAATSTNEADDLVRDELVYNGVDREFIDIKEIKLTPIKVLALNNGSES